jgi:hypothetical protein
VFAVSFASQTLSPHNEVIGFGQSAMQFFQFSVSEQVLSPQNNGCGQSAGQSFQFSLVLQLLSPHFSGGIGG